ncbi:MAG: putative GNAT family N-acyltransferase [Planctomycetota bacterium]|jgi:predicted GNAT family N-acyltransferase
MHNDYSIRQIFTDKDLASTRLIRQQVFVEEQGIPAELDEDGLDENAIHVLISINEQAQATARMIINSEREGVIARVAVLAAVRGRGYGKLLMAELENIAVRLELKRLSLHPHHYLERFYANMGFTIVPGETELAGEHLLVKMEKILS